MEETTGQESYENGKSGHQRQESATTRWDLAVKGSITGGVLLFLLTSMLFGMELSTGVVALVVIAILPWLSSILESIELPGGGSLKFRKRIERELSQTKQDVADQKQVINEQQDMLAAQQKIINELVLYSMSHLIFQHLAGLKVAKETNEEYLYQGDLEAFSRDLRFLRDHGYLHHFHIRELKEGQNLVGIANLTPVGEFLVDLRLQLDSQKQQEKERIAAKAAK